MCKTNMKTYPYYADIYANMNMTKLWCKFVLKINVE